MISRIAVIVLAAALQPAGSAAQVADSAQSVLGRVVDAVNGAGVDGATVTLTLDPAGVLPDDTTGRFAAGREARTDITGSYAFLRVAPGRYRLTIERAGYRRRVVDLELDARVAARVSVALEVEPILLQPVSVPGSAQSRFHAPGSEDVDVAGAARLSLERNRLAQHLEPDVRAVSAADITEAVTLGESDLLRAIQRMPGVVTRDEFSAELWTRGAAWNQTQIRFDGLPLLNALHGFGVLGGVQPEMVGAAFFYPGVRPAALSATGAAATLDVLSRRAGSEPAGSAELSLASGRFAYRRPLGEAGGVSIALRRTWIDWLSRIVAGATSDSHLPFHFWDGSARLDLGLAERGALEVSGLIERDGIADDIPDVLHGTRAERGNRLGRVTWALPEGRLATRVTLGGSWFDERIDAIETDPPDGLSAPGESPRRADVRHLLLSVEAQPIHTDLVSPWRVGLSVTAQHAEYDGPEPFPVPGLDAGRDLSFEQSAIRVAAWMDGRASLSERVTGEAGVRAMAGAGSAHIGPRASLRAEALPGLFVNVAGGRSFQTIQGVAPLGPWVGDMANWGMLHMLASDSVPVIRSDIVTVGGELWLGDGWLASGSAYVRETSGNATPDPRPGSALDRPVFVIADGSARGLELSVRKIAGRVTGSVSGHASAATLGAGSLAYPSPYERRFGVDAMLSATISSSLRAGAAYTFVTGAPYRRAHTDDDACDELLGCGYEAWVIERAGAQRGADYRSLDLSIDWSGHLLGLRSVLFVQLRNALAWENQGAYRLTGVDCTQICGPGFPIQYRDEFGPGMPLVPLLGFRVAF